MGRKWSESEEQFIRDNYMEMSDSELADKLDRTKNAIRNRRNKELDLKRPQSHNGKFNQGIHWNQEKVDFLKENYHDMTGHQIAEKLNCSSNGVRDKASKLGLVKNHNWTDYEILFINKVHHNGSNWTIQKIADYLDLTFDQVNNAIKTNDLSYEKQRNFSEDELSFLKNNYEDLTDSEIAEKLDRDPSFITDKRLGLGLEKTPFWSDEEVDFIKNNWEDLSDSEIAEELDRGWHGVRVKRRELGLKFDTVVDTDRHWEWESLCVSVARKVFSSEVFDNKVFQEEGLRPDIFVPEKGLVVDAKLGVYEKALEDVKKYYEIDGVENVQIWSFRSSVRDSEGVDVLERDDLVDLVDSTRLVSKLEDFGVKSSEPVVNQVSLSKVF